MCHINLCPRIYYMSDRVPPNYFLGDPHQLTADTLSDVNSDSLCGILPDIFPDIYLALYLAFFLLTFYLAFLLAFYLPYFLTVYFAFCLTHTHTDSILTFFFGIRSGPCVPSLGSVCPQPDLELAVGFGAVLAQTELELATSVRIALEFSKGSGPCVLTVDWREASHEFLVRDGLVLFVRSGSWCPQWRQPCGRRKEDEEEEGRRRKKKEEEGRRRKKKEEEGRRRNKKEQEGRRRKKKEEEGRRKKRVKEKEEGTRRKKEEESHLSWNLETSGILRQAGKYAKEHVRKCVRQNAILKLNLPVSISDKNVK